MSQVIKTHAAWAWQPEFVPCIPTRRELTHTDFHKCVVTLSTHVHVHIHTHRDREKDRNRKIETKKELQRKRHTQRSTEGKRYIYVYIHVYTHTQRGERERYTHAHTEIQNKTSNLTERCFLNLCRWFFSFLDYIATLENTGATPLVFP